jgi:hypothetical protein
MNELLGKTVTLGGSTVNPHMRGKQGTVVSLQRDAFRPLRIKLHGPDFSDPEIVSVQRHEVTH